MEIGRFCPPNPLNDERTCDTIQPTLENLLPINIILAAAEVITSLKKQEFQHTCIACNNTPSRACHTAVSSVSNGKVNFRDATLPVFARIPFFPWILQISFQ